MGMDADNRRKFFREGEAPTEPVLPIRQRICGSVALPFEVVEKIAQSTGRRSESVALAGEANWTGFVAACDV